MEYYFQLGGGQFFHVIMERGLIKYYVSDEYIEDYDGLTKVYDKNEMIDLIIQINDERVMRFNGEQFTIILWYGKDDRVFCIFPEFHYAEDDDKIEWWGTENTELIDILELKWIWVK